MAENKNSDISDLLNNTEEGTKSEEITFDTKKTTLDIDDENKLFRKFKIKDIVFLAIMAAIMLVTGAVMPLVGQVPVFGIIQVALGIQFSLFPTIGMMKVRKTGSLLLMALFTGAFLAMMSPLMFFVMLLCAVITEVVTVAIFRGYKRDGACLFAGTLYFPLSLPFLYVWYKYIYTMTGEEGESVTAMVGSSAGVAIGMTIAVVALCFVGALIGVIISRELKKSGVMKK